MIYTYFTNFRLSFIQNIEGNNLLPYVTFNKIYCVKWKGIKDISKLQKIQKSITQFFWRKNFFLPMCVFSSFLIREKENFCILIFKAETPLNECKGGEGEWLWCSFIVLYFVFVWKSYNGDDFLLGSWKKHFLFLF